MVVVAIIVVVVVLVHGSSSSGCRCDSGKGGCTGNLSTYQACGTFGREPFFKASFSGGEPFFDARLKGTKKFLMLL